MNNDAIRIYRDAFGDDGDFAERLFNTFGNIAEKLTVNGKTVSLLFPLPCTLETEKEKIPAKYIFAAATDTAHRGNGFMSELIRKVCRNDEIFYFLRPATPELIAFYKRLGFKEITGSGNTENLPRIIVGTQHRNLAGGVCEDGVFTLMYKYSKPVDIKNLTFGYSMF